MKTLREQFRGVCEECKIPLEFKDAYIAYFLKDGSYDPLRRNRKNRKIVCSNCIDRLEKRD